MTKTNTINQIHLKQWQLLESSSKSNWICKMICYLIIYVYCINNSCFAMIVDIKTTKHQHWCLCQIAPKISMIDNSRINFLSLLLLLQRSNFHCSIIGIISMFLPEEFLFYYIFLRTNANYEKFTKQHLHSRICNKIKIPLAKT